MTSSSGLIDRPNDGKVFGIGLSRTGTVSLNIALRGLGFNVVHYPTDSVTYRELTSGQYRLTILEHHAGITDIVVAPFYPQLDRVYPSSRFILTTREESSWLESMEEHWRNRSVLGAHLNGDPRVEAMRFFRAAVYGTYEFSRERMSYVKRLHEQNVLRYFQDRTDSLLVLNIAEGDEWDKLAPFLGVPSPNIPFPIANMRGEQPTP